MTKEEGINKSSFYPHHGPKKYSYTSDFFDYRPKTGVQAKSNTAYPNIGNEKRTHIKALINIQRMMVGARAAEMTFLAETGIDLTNANNAKTIFNLFNKILAAEDQTSRALQYLKQLSTSRSKIRDTDKTYREVSRFFTYYLEKSLQKHLYGTHFNVAERTDTQLERDIDKILGDALENTYKSVKDFVNSKGELRMKNGAYADSRGQEEQVAVLQMLETIQSLKNTGLFGKFGHLFDLNREYFQSLTREGKGKIIVKKPTIAKSLDNRYGGAALELIDSAIAAEFAKVNIKTKDFTITGQSTGQKNEMKADAMLLVSATGTVNIPDFLDFVQTGKDQSVRVQNIKALEEFLEKLADRVQHVIMISDKNFSITTNFGGIDVQSSMNLKNLGAMLGQFGVRQVEELINFLANCGPDMIHPEGANQIRTTLASYIGYFLFDHLEIAGTVTTGPNVVNIINASGVYLPLSVFLEGFYNALKGVEGNPSSFVSVSISPGGPTSGVGYTPWTPGVWQKFRSEHELQTTVSYKILSNLASFITGLV